MRRVFIVILITILLAATVYLAAVLILKQATKPEAEKIMPEEKAPLPAFDANDYLDQAINDLNQIE